LTEKYEKLEIKIEMNNMENSRYWTLFSIIFLIAKAVNEQDGNFHINKAKKKYDKYSLLAL
jgi:hypothetical protein